MWRVAVDFADLQDNGYVYHAGDDFPRVGTADPSRIAELAGFGNRIGVPLIEEYKPSKRKKTE